MKRITRDSYLTPEEAQHYNTIREKVAQEYGIVDSPIKWWGGKYYLAQRIVKLMPPHIHYVEPFAGSMAVLFAKEQPDILDHSELVNDINGDLTNFWRVLKYERSFEQFKRLIEATPFSEIEFNEPPQYYDDVEQFPSVDSAVHFFVRCRMSRAADFVSFTPVSRNRTRRGMNEQCAAWLTAVEGLPAIHDRLKRVLITCRDIMDIIDTQDGPNTLFYLDPPYLHETRASVGNYRFEFSDAQHDALLRRLTYIRGKFILSGYENELYNGYATRNNWRSAVYQLPNNTAGGSEKRTMSEVVWMNY